MSDSTPEEVYCNRSSKKTFHCRAPLCSDLANHADRDSRAQRSSKILWNRFGLTFHVVGADGPMAVVIEQSYPRTPTGGGGGRASRSISLRGRPTRSGAPVPKSAAPDTFHTVRRPLDLG